MATTVATWFYRARVLGIAILAATMAACGGGGGGSSGTPNNPPPPPPSGSTQSISGLVMLGPVANADVEVIGTDGVLATGTTASDGSFGPIDYDGDYAGPLRIRVTGKATATWVCDAKAGCAAGDFWVAYGQSLPFDGTVEAVLAAAEDGQTVTVSMLSNWVAKRADALGPLSAATVDAAQADIAALLREVMSLSLDVLALDIPEDFSTLGLFDLHALPPASGPDDALILLLSFFNAAMQGLGVDGQTSGELIDVLSGQVAADPQLPVAQAEFWAASKESITTMMAVQLNQAYLDGNPAPAALDALFAPADFISVLNAAAGQAAAIPALFVQDDYPEYLQSPGQWPSGWEVPILAPDNAALTPDEVGLRIFDDGAGDPVWLSAETTLVNGALHLRVLVDGSVVPILSNGRHTIYVEVFSTTGAYARDYFIVLLDVYGPEASAGNNVWALEGSTVTLTGTTTQPQGVASVSWTQVEGPAVVIEDFDTLMPTVTLPKVDQATDALLELTVNFVGGSHDSDQMAIYIQTYPAIADLDFADAVLQQCVRDAAAAGGLVSVDDLTELVCPGTTDLSGLEAFVNLETLDLSASALTSLAPLLMLEKLVSVDLRGNPGLPCAELDELGERLGDGTGMLAGSTCRGAFSFDLGADGFDVALDAARGRIYVSVPALHEIVVISTTDFRIMDRLKLPGTPYGIDLGIDGTRLFAALHSNAVAVIDIETRAVSTIDVGAGTGHMLSYDVVEGAPGRLFVTAESTSGGNAYVAQVLLGQGNAVSTVANGRRLVSRPTLARSPGHDFVYAGETFLNTLFRLSLASPDAPIVLESEYNSLHGADQFVLNTDGTRMRLSSGEVLPTASFVVDGETGRGPGFASTTTNNVFVYRPGGVIVSYDFDTLAETGSIQTQCRNGGGASHVVVFDGDDAWFLLQEDAACVEAVVPRTLPPDPYARFRFPDLAFEQCVIAAADAMGYEWPGQVRNLDCSTSPQTIRSLDGVERLTNLETLDISASEVTDVSPMSGLGALQSFVARDVPISSTAPLLDIATLNFVDFTGNPMVACDGLDALAGAGVSILADACQDAVQVDLRGAGHDLAYAGSGNRLYVSIPSRSRVVAVNLDSGVIDQHFVLPVEPRGIDLSADGRTLYIAMYGSGDIGVLDTSTSSLETIDLSASLGNDDTWDVLEVSDGRVLATTRAGSGGTGYVVEVRRDLGDQVTRVAGQRILQAEATLAVSEDRTAVYVGEGTSPNDLLRLDATQPGLPLMLEDEHRDIWGVWNLSLNPAGTRLYLASGQALDTATLRPVAQFPAGISTASGNGRVYIGDTDTDQVRIHDAATTGQVATQAFGCDIRNLAALKETDAGIVALGDELLCYTRTIAY